MRTLKKSQAAIEFLATYGWAFLIILIVIGALSYFGVLSPSKLLPDRCNFGSELSCTDYSISSNGIKLSLRNNAGQSITLDSLAISTEQSQISCDVSAGGMWKSGQVKTLLAACDFSNSGLVLGDKSKVNVKVAYHLSKSGSSFSKEVKGEVFATMQPASTLLSPVAFWHFNEVSGASLKDSSGNNNNGNLFNGPNWVLANKANGLSFDGVDDYVDVANSPSLNIPGSLSVTAWVNFMSQANGFVITKGIYPDYNYKIEGYSGKFQAIVGIDGAQRIAIDTSSFEVGRWYHVALTYDGTAVRLYVDGMLKTTTPYSGVPAQNTYPVTIGRYYGGPGYYINGVIDEIKIYSRALTPEEVPIDYNS